MQTRRGVQMAVKDQVLSYLEQHKGSFVSGPALASQLGVSRNTVWKAIKALEAQGYAIEGVTNKGYRLATECSILSAASIERYLDNDGIHVEFHQSITSTNDRAKELATAGAPQGTLVVADCQTAGRGRQGRVFYSPAGSGIYFSLILRPRFALSDVTYITSYAAMCAARAMEEIFGVEVAIKWVNDIFVAGHKCCGILTEAAVLPETGGVDYAVVGIGINVAVPKGGFPEQFKEVAQALTPHGADAQDARARLVARIASLMMSDVESIPSRPHLEAYRAHSLLDGRRVRVYRGSASFEALVIGINDDFTLQVRHDDGHEEALSSGEVHIPSSQL